MPVFPETPFQFLGLFVQFLEQHGIFFIRRILPRPGVTVADHRGIDKDLVIILVLDRDDNPVEVLADLLKVDLDLDAFEHVDQHPAVFIARCFIKDQVNVLSLDPCPQVFRGLIADLLGVDADQADDFSVGELDGPAVDDKLDHGVSFRARRRGD